MHTASLGRQMGSSQHKSPHQARAFRRGHDVVTNAKYVFSRTYIYLKWLHQPEPLSAHLSARWADLTIRLVLKANRMHCGMLIKNKSNFLH